MVKIRFHKKSTKNIGQPPGTLVHIGDKKVEKVNLEIISYNQDSFVGKKIENLEDIESSIKDGNVNWLSIDGIHDDVIIKKIGDIFKINSLTLEDIMNANQHPKVEDFEEYLFFILRTAYYSKVSNVMHFENVSIILGKNFVISFQEKEIDIFNTLKDRIKTSNGRVRKKGNDYLAYSLIDTIVDHYLPTLEYLGDKIESIEERILEEPKVQPMNEIHQMRREILLFTKVARPLREMIGYLERQEPEIIQDDTYRYLRDVYDHVIHVLETLDINRDLIAGMVEIHLSSISNRMNEVMKTLTIIASIFIPITFVAGIYGMNFSYMPELDVQVGYFIVLGAMATISIGMITYFKKKAWL